MSSNREAAETSSGRADSRHGIRTRLTLKRGGLLDHILRFAAVGIVGFIINASIVAYFSTKLGPIMSQALAFPAAVTATWLLNRQYTFGASKHSWHMEWARYVSANALGWSTNNGVYFFLIFRFYETNHNPVLAVAAGSLAGMTFNFIISKWIVFK